jgi:replicative DNA helicase
MQPQTEETGTLLLMPDRSPPSNIEAESDILGGLMLFSPDAMNRVLDILTPDMFYVKGHGEIYQAMLDLNAGMLPIDLMTVISRLRDRGTLDKVGGQSGLLRMVESTVSSVNIDHYAELVADKYKRRCLIQAGSEISSLAFDTTEPIPEICDRAEQKLFGVTQSQSSNQTVSASAAVVAAFNRLEIMASGGEPPGIRTGFHELDALTEGLQPSALIIVAARPAMGKSSFMDNVAESVAVQGKPVLLFSLEMSSTDIINRMVCRHTGIDMGRISGGRIQPDEWCSIIQANEAISKLPLEIDENPNPTISYLRGVARRVQAARGGLGLICIDYLQLMGSESGTNRVQELSKITRSLKQLARELSVPIVVLSQLNRGVEARDNKRPMMSDLKESGSIEQDADVVMMLYRDEYYRPDTQDQGVAEVIIAKQRNGPTGTVKLLFDGRVMAFRNMNGSSTSVKPVKVSEVINVVSVPAPAAAPIKVEPRIDPQVRAVMEQYDAN